MPQWKGIEPQNSFLLSRSWEDKLETVKGARRHRSALTAIASAIATYGNATKSITETVSDMGSPHSFFCDDARC